MTSLMTTAGGELLDRPEALFVIRPDAPPGIPVDAIDCAVGRARSVLMLLSSQFENLEEPCTFSNAVVCDALWTVEGILEEIRILANNREHDRPAKV